MSGIKCAVKSIYIQHQQQVQDEVPVGLHLDVTTIYTRLIWYLSGLLRHADLYLVLTFRMDILRQSLVFKNIKFQNGV
jgi:hypothetical protein